jgi:putative tryptophan/tyrosine transport system substrate-binding protein
MIMRRRIFIALLGGAVIAPPPGFAQQNQPRRRIAMLLPYAEDDPEGLRRLEVVREGLRQLGWNEGSNLHVEIRWLGSEPALNARQYAAELVQLNPEVIFRASTTGVAALVRATNTIPIVFAFVNDPVAKGFVASLARPGGNVTGFAGSDSSIAEKCLELLMEVAPLTRRISFLYNPEAGERRRRDFEAASTALGVMPVAVPVRSIGEIESAFAATAEAQGSGVIVQADIFLFDHRGMIVALAACYRLPAIYPLRAFVVSGGLLSYGPDAIDTYRRAPTYIDRILRGEHPEELPVQEPDKFELVINLNTARTLGLTIPALLFARAGEVIE